MTTTTTASSAFMARIVGNGHDSRQCWNATCWNALIAGPDAYRADRRQARRSGRARVRRGVGRCVAHLEAERLDQASLTALMELPMSGLMEPLTGADLESRTG